MKNSIVLLELIFSIVLFSLLGLMVSNIEINLYKQKNAKVSQTFTNLKLEATRLFIVKNGVSNISYEDNSVYFKDNLLLDKVSSYKIVNSGVIVTIDICIDDNTVCQQWKIKV